MTESLRKWETELLPGMSLDVLTPDNKLIFQGRIEQVGEGSIQIIDSHGKQLPPVVYNSQLKLRGTLPRGRVVVLRGKVCGSTERFWKIEETGLMQVQEKREDFRQRVQVAARVLFIEDMEMVRTAPELLLSREGEPCTLLDISGGGALVRCKKPFRVGDWLYLQDVHVLPEERAFSFICCVRRVQQEEKENLYGCQFEGLSSREEDRLVRAIFTIQRRSQQMRDVREDV